jgi:hypothetical protein
VQRFGASDCPKKIGGWVDDEIIFQFFDVAFHYFCGILFVHGLAYFRLVGDLENALPGRPGPVSWIGGYMDLPGNILGGGNCSRVDLYEH